MYVSALTLQSRMPKQVARTGIARLWAVLSVQYLADRSLWPSVLLCVCYIHVLAYHSRECAYIWSVRLHTVLSVRNR